MRRIRIPKSKILGKLKFRKVKLLLTFRILFAESAKIVQGAAPRPGPPRGPGGVAKFLQILKRFCRNSAKI